MEREEWGEGREKNSKVEVVREIDGFFSVRSRTSSGAVEGAVESVMAGELRTKKLMMKLRLTVEVRDGGDGME